MRILFISYYLPPLLYPQSIQIGRFLNYLKEYPELDITVLTANENSNVDNELYPNIFDGINVIKVENNFNMYVNYVKNRLLSFIYQRPDSFVSWMNRAFNTIISKHKRDSFDVILTFSYPLSTNILGMKLKDYFNCKWIAHNSDPWIDNPHAHFKSYMINVNTDLEKKSFEKADKLVFTSIETCDFYKNKYPDLIKKIDYINHSFDRNMFKDNNLVNEKIILRYIGSFYGKRTPKALLEAIKNIDEEYLDRFCVEFVGGGKKAKIMLSEYKLKNVSVIEPVSYMESLMLMSSADYLLVIDAPSKNTSIFFPSKLADYIGSCKSILGISPEGTTSRIIKDLGYNCYNTFEIEGIVKELINIVNSNFSQNNNINIDKIKKYDIKENIIKLKGIISE
ncbi:hypothetical protein LXN10_03430 [Arcobacter sp. KX21116]|uniref:hypothetical protein n=1 Tax=Arcobacter iocasae TaxID=2906515 RepID=UPI0035D4BEF9